MFGFGRQKADALFDALYRAPVEKVAADDSTTNVVAVTDLPAGTGYSRVVVRDWNSDTYPGGFGDTIVPLPDYWTLRARSAQLFRTDLHARGIVRRLVTSEIAKGLEPEAVPEAALLALPGRMGDLSDWTEMTEARFALWANSPQLCDVSRRLTFGQLQAQARLEALVAGDVLVVLHTDEVTGLPRIQLIDGSHVQTPLDATPAAGNEIVHGVELDRNRQHIAFYVRQKGGSYQRIPATGNRGLPNAWLLFGSDKRHDDVRGEPILSLVAQSLRDIGRYRNATLKKSAINAALIAWISKEGDELPLPPALKGALGNKNFETVDTPNGPQKRAFSSMEIGTFLDTLEPGEKLNFHGSQGTDEKYGDFAKVILSSIAWSIEMPPEVLLENFDKSFSAAQAANAEYRLYLDKVRPVFGANFCAPIYRSWLIAEVLHRRIEAPGLLEAWRDPKRYDETAAWTASDWSGQVKAHVDPVKVTNAYIMQIEAGLITRERATRELNGGKFSKNIKRLAMENPALAEVNASLQALQAPAPSPEDEAEDDVEPDDEQEDDE